MESMTKRFLILPLLFLLASCSPKATDSSTPVPSTPTVPVVEDTGGLLETAETAESIKRALHKGDIAEEFSGPKAYQIALHALLKQDESPYSLSVSHSRFGASFLGIPYDIDMKMGTYSTPEESFVEGLVDGGIVIKRALRCYDQLQNSCSVYQGRTKEDFPEAEETTSDYDGFLDTFGMLFHKEFYVLEDKETGNETFLGDDRETFDSCQEEGKRQRTGSTLININHDTILDGDVKENKDGTFTISLTLDEVKGNQYYAKLFSKVAGLHDELHVHGCQIDFLLDKDLNLISSTYTTRLDVPILILGEIVYFNDVEQVMQTNYLRSEDGTFKQGEERIDLTIPDTEETEFDGYAFLPEIEDNTEEQ